MQNINVGLIGCGRIAGLVYLNLLKKQPGVRLAAIAESDTLKREQAGKSVPGAALYADYTDLLKDPGINAVVICLPNEIHAESAIAAFETGKHVYLEKPIATSVTRAKDLLRAWKESGLVGMTGFNLRFNPTYMSLKKHIESGTIGEIIRVRTAFTYWRREFPEWRKRRLTGGGAMLDIGSHHVDLVRFIFNADIIRISARISSHNTEGDNAMCEFKTSGGIDVQSYFSITSIDEDKIEVYGSRGKLTADRFNSNLRVVIPDSQRLGLLPRIGSDISSLLHSRNLKDKIFFPRKEPSFESALGHFFSAVKGLEPASPDLNDGYKSLAVIEAAEESAKTGFVISIRDFET